LRKIEAWTGNSALRDTGRERMGGIDCRRRPGAARQVPCEVTGRSEWANSVTVGAGEYRIGSARGVGTTAGVGVMVVVVRVRRAGSWPKVRTQNHRRARGACGHHEADRHQRSQCEQQQRRSQKAPPT